MNSRERVICAIKQQDTDRPCSNFRAEPTAINKIIQYMGTNNLDIIQDELETDIRHIDAIQPAVKNLNGFSQNFWGERYIYYNTTYGSERENIDGAFADMISMDEFESFDWGRNDDFNHCEILSQCRKYENRAIMYGNGDVWQRAVMMRGMQNFFVDMYENPEFCHYMCNRLTEFYIEDYRRAYEASKGRIDIFLIYSDLGGQRSPLISNDMLQTFVVPYLKRVADAVHDMDAYLFFHTCGMVAPFIPKLIETGVDILDPIQAVDISMEPESLSKNYKGQLCFHGGIDVQKLLITGTFDEIKTEVERYINAFYKKCGYICAPSHFFQRDIPVKNIISMYKAIKNYKYK